VRRSEPALLFALAGAVAAAAHVLAETPAELRDWRQTLPLAAAVGAAFGGAFRPRGAGGGGVLAAAGLFCFALVWAAGHALIEGSLSAFGAGLAGALRDLAGAGGAAALAAGTAAGWAAGRRAPSTRPRS
jgi:hypothetical protein